MLERCWHQGGWTNKERREGRTQGSRTHGQTELPSSWINWDTDCGKWLLVSPLPRASQALPAGAQWNPCLTAAHTLQRKPLHYSVSVTPQTCLKSNGLFGCIFFQTRSLWGYWAHTSCAGWGLSCLLGHFRIKASSQKAGPEVETGLGSIESSHHLPSSLCYTLFPSLNFMLNQQSRKIRKSYTHQQNADLSILLITWNLSKCKWNYMHNSIKS